MEVGNLETIISRPRHVLTYLYVHDSAPYHRLSTGMSLNRHVRDTLPPHKGSPVIPDKSGLLVTVADDTSNMRMVTMVHMDICTFIVSVAAGLRSLYNK